MFVNTANVEIRIGLTTIDIPSTGGEERLLEETFYKRNNISIRK
jgi:hypothetical protein